MQLYNYLFILSYILLFSPTYLLAQEEEVKHEEHRLQHHRISLFTGYGLISGSLDPEGNSNQKLIPVIGLDYEYFFNHKVGLGIINDLELTSYSIEIEHQEYLERAYAFVSALVFIYEPIVGWALIAGPGYEFEKNHGFALFKIGTELSKNFDHGWSVGIAASIDIKEVNSSLNFGLTAAKRFGR